MLIGVILFATCLGKALDIEGYLRVLETYRTFPHWSLPIVGCAVLMAEGGLAVWLLSGRHVALVSLFAAFLHFAFTALSAITLLRGIAVPNCGCFGVFLARPLTWGTVLEDVFMIGLCLALYALSDRKLRAI